MRPVFGQITLLNGIEKGASPDAYANSLQFVPSNVQTYFRRALSLQYFALKYDMDKLDFVQADNQPVNALLEQINFEKNRFMDRLAIRAAVGTAKGGEDGSTSITLASFNSGSQVISDVGNTGLTYAKLLLALGVARRNDMALEGPNKPVLFCGTDGLMDLQAEANFIQGLYIGADNPNMPNVTGRVGSVLGFDVVHTTVLDEAEFAYSGTQSQALLIGRDALVQGMSPGIDGSIKVWEESDINFNMRVQYDINVGFARMKESGVIQIPVTN
jgi:hypothetical protein